MKKIFIGVILFVFTIMLTGCKNKIPFNAKIYGTYNNYLKQEFVDSNPLFEPRWDEPTEENQGLPSDRTFIVNDKTTFDSMFKENTLEVDFSNQMVLVYLYKYVHTNRELKLKKLHYQSTTTETNGFVTSNSTLDIEFSTKNTKLKDAQSPSTHYAIVVMKKLVVDTCTFKHLGLS